MKKLSITFLLLAFSFGLFAESVSLESAKNVAVNVYKHFAEKTTDYSISDVAEYKSGQISTFYIFVFKSGGFVIVSADDAVTPVLGYSLTDPFDKNNLPVNAQSWYNSYNTQIKLIIDNKLDNSVTIKEWKRIQNNEFNQSKFAVNPLCTTTWDQGCYYNAQCPADAAASWTCGKCYTGCVATAMAQIMKFWSYPTTGTGTHSYTHPTYGTLTANFGATTYNWASMPNNVTSTNSSVATLMYHCGVSVNMNYATDGSGAYSWDVPSSLINNFNYSPTAEIKFLADFTSANWILMLKTELDAGRPMYYSGTDGTSGHAFVCDGYDNTNKFHFNWGWSGSSNGYYTIGSLNPSGNTFNQDNSVIVRIKPPSSAPIADFVASTTTPPVATTVSFINNSTNNPTSYSWVFDGGSPATSTLQTPPAITYAVAGYYQVSLAVTNANGTDIKIRSAYINVGGTPSAWIKQNSGFTTANRAVDQISIVNPYIVWAKAYDGTSPTTYIREFTRTKNGGISWTPGTISFTNSTNFGVSNLFAINDTICYACMFPITGTGGKIIKTIDGGLTWAEQTTAPFTNSWADFVHFFNANDGVCMGDPSGTDFVIYTTTNGGTTWTQVPVANIPNCLSGEAGITNMYDASNNIIWFGTTMGRIYKSVDKGLNWTVSATGMGTTSTVTPVFKDALVGIVTGIATASPYAYIGMKKTIDGGITWATVTPTGFYVKSPDIDFVPGTTSMWVDVSASLSTATTTPGSSYSLNDCTSFLDIDTGSVQYTTVSFYDYNTGWAGGFNQSSTDGGIYKWDSSTLTSLPELLNEVADEIKVYPNPVNDFVNIEFSSVTENNVIANIYNVLGKRIMSKEIPKGTSLTTIDIAGNEAGVYFLTIDNGIKVISKMISKIE